MNTVKEFIKFIFSDFNYSVVFVGMSMIVLVVIIYIIANIVDKIKERIYKVICPDDDDLVI